LSDNGALVIEQRPFAIHARPRRGRAIAGLQDLDQLFDKSGDSAMAPWSWPRSLVAGCVILGLPD
jgi:hypothetical protein